MLIALLLLGGALALSYAFRTEYHSNPALGRIGGMYRWGKPFALVADTNRDGENDFRGLVARGEPYFSTHMRYQEWWEDRDFDGSYDLHAVNDPADAYRTVKTVELDEDKDGKYETVLRDEAAKAYLKARVLPSSQETNN